MFAMRTAGYCILSFTSISGLFGVSQASLPQGAQCFPPSWKSPAESSHGTFRGDLALTCTLVTAGNLHTIDRIQTGIQHRIETESTIHSGPVVDKTRALPTMTWDVSHRIQEDGNTIQIREQATLSGDQHTHLLYSTHSKEVTASGMGSYLRSVDFSLQVDQTHDQLMRIIFENEVRVDRPWFALDLIFAPIARNVCLQKMEQVTQKLLPWIQSLISVQDPAL